MKRKLVWLCLALFSAVSAPSGLAANPYLNAVDDKAAMANFKGAEWNDQYEAGEYPLHARVETVRLAMMKWGAIFRVSFETINSKAPQKREIQPLHLVVTNDNIFLLNETDIKEAIRKLTETEKAPAFEKSDLRALTAGSRKIAGELTKETVAVKGDRCAYLSSHNSGHFTRMTWKRGVGLIEYGQGYGARQDGFSLKRETATVKPKPPSQTDGFSKEISRRGPQFSRADLRKQSRRR